MLQDIFLTYHVSIKKWKNISLVEIHETLSNWFCIFGYGKMMTRNYTHVWMRIVISCDSYRLFLLCKVHLAYSTIRIFFNCHESYAKYSMLKNNHYHVNQILVIRTVFFRIPAVSISSWGFKNSSTKKQKKIISNSDNNRNYQRFQKWYLESQRW